VSILSRDRQEAVFGLFQLEHFDIIQKPRRCRSCTSANCLPLELSRNFESSRNCHTPGGQEYDLAPDAEKNLAGKITQTWNLKDYRTMNLFLRCRYHDTSATLFMDVPTSYTSCTFTFALDKKGVFIGKSNLLCR